MAEKVGELGRKQPVSGITVVILIICLYYKKLVILTCLFPSHMCPRTIRDASMS